MRLKISEPKGTKGNYRPFIRTEGTRNASGEFTFKVIVPFGYEDGEPQFRQIVNIDVNFDDPDALNADLMELVIIGKAFETAGIHTNLYLENLPYQNIYGKFRDPDTDDFVFVPDTLHSILSILSDAFSYIQIEEIKDKSYIQLFDNIIYS